MTIISVHLLKTAGTSLAASLADHFGDGFRRDTEASEADRSVVCAADRGNANETGPAESTGPTMSLQLLG